MDSSFKRKKEKGQSTVEFLLSFTLVLGFVFSFLSLALTFTNGYLLHYGTFMASRAYMVFDDDSDDPSLVDSRARQWASQAFDQYNLDLLIESFSELNFNAPSDPSFQTSSTNLYTGVWTEVIQAFVFPGVAESLGINLRSESFLGREPTRSECFRQVCESMDELGVDGCINHVTVADNGC